MEGDYIVKRQSRAARTDALPRQASDARACACASDARDRRGGRALPRPIPRHGITRQGRGPMAQLSHWKKSVETSAAGT